MFKIMLKYIALWVIFSFVAYFIGSASASAIYLVNHFNILEWGITARGTYVSFCALFLILWIVAAIEEWKNV